MANWAWPEIVDEDSARTAAHTAAGWAIFVAGLTTLLAVVSMFTAAAIMGISAYSLVDAALFGLVAWRVWNGSRPWAVAGLALYCLEIVINIVDHPPGVGILTFIVLIALINGVRGTFSLHKYQEERKQMSLQQQDVAQAFAASMPSSGIPPPPPPPLG